MISKRGGPGGCFDLNEAARRMYMNVTRRTIKMANIEGDIFQNVLWDSKKKEDTKAIGYVMERREGVVK